MQKSESKNTLDEIVTIIVGYVDYAESELFHGDCDSRGVIQSSTIGAKRGDMNVEISISVICKKASDRNI